jgi:hypothetical protein
MVHKLTRPNIIGHFPLGLYEEYCLLAENWRSLDSATSHNRGNWNSDQSYACKHVAPDRILFHCASSNQLLTLKLIGDKIKLSFVLLNCEITSSVQYIFFHIQIFIIPFSDTSVCVCVCVRVVCIYMLILVVYYLASYLYVSLIFLYFYHILSLR